MSERTANLPVLKVTCTSTDCVEGLHCFLPTSAMRREGRVGACRACGAELVNWDRVHHLRLDDVDYTFEALQSEYFRHRYWHLEIDQRAVNHAKRKGRLGLRAAALSRLDKSVRIYDEVWDGRQTPLAENAIYYAQHAVAACCRNCMETWYGIPKDVELEDDQLNFLHELMCKYIDIRLPELGDEGVKVPPIKRRKQ